MREIYVEEVNFEDYSFNKTIKVYLSRAETGFTLKELKKQFPYTRFDLFIGMYRVPDNFINETVISELVNAYYTGFAAGGFNKRIGLYDEEDD